MTPTSVAQQNITDLDSECKSVNQPESDTNSFRTKRYLATLGENWDIREPLLRITSPKT